LGRKRGEGNLSGLRGKKSIFPQSPFREIPKYTSLLSLCDEKGKKTKGCPRGGGRLGAGKERKKILSEGGKSFRTSYCEEKRGVAIKKGQAKP